MKTKTIILSLSLLLLSGTAVADDDCDDPVASWQPREHLREKLEAEGWTVHRIKVDDGCYEVRGLDADGIRAEASFAPASLTMMKWEREDTDDDDRDHGNRNTRNGQENVKSQAPRNGIVNGRPTVTVE
ncbi:PepSY domain-containing protein [uncultured Marinobacter sp.]|uniref:PepSY domain-containing protein n=1 Tax=uncultured Marinobacter sp. TaxID=187379 RepID=UPI0030D8E64E|tara:strand:- start:108 stop:494 length:387 start_codon:yes stop_codon:yes gene_type:complete